MLETERLILRPINESDIDGIFAMRADVDVMRFIREPIGRRDEARHWADHVSRRWAGERIGFCSLIEKRSGRFIGWCGLWQLKETGETEVGYALAKEFWGKGYATEAASAFLRYGFTELHIEKIVAVANPANTASRRVMEKLGMDFDYTGEFYGRDLVHYSISREKFISAKTDGPLTRRRADGKHYD